MRSISIRAAFRSTLLRRLSTTESGTGKAMETFIKSASAKSEGSTAPLWGRLVRDLTPPPQPETLMRDKSNDKPYGAKRKGKKRTKMEVDEDENNFDMSEGKQSRNFDIRGKDQSKRFNPFAINEDEEDEEDESEKAEGDKLEGAEGEEGGEGEEGEDDDDEDDEDDEDDDGYYDEDGEYHSNVEFDEDGRKLKRKDEAFEQFWNALMEPKRDAMQGNEADLRGVHPLEGALVHGLFESYKTESNQYKDAYTLSDFNKTRIPKPRSMRQLIMAQRPNLDSSIPEGSEGYTAAIGAWNAVHGNIFYTDSEKKTVCDLIGAKTNAVMEYINTGPLSNTVENPDQAYDPIFRFGFRKGLETILNEEKEAAKRDSLKTTKKTFVQGETNWDVEAVEDEDSL